MRSRTFSAIFAILLIGSTGSFAKSVIKEKQNVPVEKLIADEAERTTTLLPVLQDESGIEVELKLGSSSGPTSKPLLKAEAIVETTARDVADANDDAEVDADITTSATTLLGGLGLGLGLDLGLGLGLPEVKVPEVKVPTLENLGLPQVSKIRGVSRDATPAPPLATIPTTTQAPAEVGISPNSPIAVSNSTDSSYIHSANRSPCLCGVPLATRKANYTEDEQTLNRIVGGEAAYIRDYPWTVGLLRKGFLGFGASKTPFCGGTLINNLYVITASHCVDGQVSQGLQVLVNEQDLLSSDESKSYVVQVDRIIMHPGYDRRTIDNDIAIIKLAEPIDFHGENVITRPACLPATNTFDFNGLNATTAGWGTTSQGGSQSKTLLKVDVPVITNEVCNGPDTKYTGKITDNMLCAGNLESGGKDACQGDSGGPLIIENGGRRTLVGVVSWGYGCAQPKSPGVYTRVSRYPAWILANTQDAKWCS